MKTIKNKEGEKYAFGNFRYIKFKFMLLNNYNNAEASRLAVINNKLKDNTIDGVLRKQVYN